MKNNSSSLGCILGIVAAVVLIIVGCSPEMNLFGLASTVLRVIAVGLVLLLILVAVVIFFAFHSNKTSDDTPKDPVVEISDERKAILDKGRANALKLRSMMMRLRDTSIRQQGLQVCSSMDKILSALKEKPDSIPSVRKFFNIYLPALGDLILRYDRVERSGTTQPELKEKVTHYLSDIQQAMEKQYANLYETDVLDMTAEMEAMTQSFQQDGLLTDKQYSPDSAEESAVNLTL